MKLTFEQWIQYGIDNDFCSRPYCDQHQRFPDEDRETIDELWQYSGGDHCMSVLQLRTTELQDQLDHYKEEEAEERKRSLVEPVEDFL